MEAAPNSEFFLRFTSATNFPGDGGDVLSAAQQDHVTASVLCEESSRYFRYYGDQCRYSLDLDIVIYM